MKVSSKHFCRWILGFALLLGAARSSDGENLTVAYPGPSPALLAAAAKPNDAAFGSPSKVRLLIVLAWEGRELAPYNIEALREFRARFRDVSFLHLVSPAYFTRPGADAAQVSEAMRAVMRPQDQLALLLSGWQSLANKAGVIYRPGPTFWGYSPRANDCPQDCGLDVPLSLYSDADLDKLFAVSLTTLQDHGLGRPRGFAAEGWMASPQVLDAATRSGMRYDFSAVAPELLSRSLRNYPLYTWVKGLWPQVTPHSQPYPIPTSHGDILEVPQSLAAMDYLADHESFAIFKEYAERASHDAQANLVFPMVVYQETAREMLPLLASALQETFGYATANRVSLGSATFAGLALPAGAAGRNSEPLPPPPPAAPSAPQRDNAEPNSAPAGPAQGVGAMPIAH